MITITFDKEISKIADKLSGKLKNDFMIASDSNLSSEQKAYFIGLFVKCLKINYPDIYVDIDSDIKSLTAYYDDTPLKKYYLLKKHLPVSTKPPYSMIVLFLFGLTFVILGIKRHIDGLFTVTYNLKTKLPTYMTGLLGVMFGIVAIIIAYSVIQRGQKIKQFYKDYSIKNNSA